MHEDRSVLGEENCFVPFARIIDSSELPQKFTFPFYYEPHPLCLEAVAALQQYLSTQQDWEHNFGLQEGQSGLVIGKMFGVLLVEKADGAIGYLAAFSGKLANSNTLPRFVPPIFDMLQDNSFFVVGEKEIHQVTLQIAALESDTTYQDAVAALRQEQDASERDIALLRFRLKEKKAARKFLRETEKRVLASSDYEELCAELIRQSLSDNAQLKHCVQVWKDKINLLTIAVDQHREVINRLKESRKQASAALQERLFDQYNFINKQGEYKNVRSIFDREPYDKPPAGAGECATPKLLQYAFLHGMKPLAMAEFWWGQSPVSEIRKHQYFYPACKGKCEPILAHMLEDVEMDDNPMLVQEDLGAAIATIYEDDHIVVVNKPAEFLSVPGINIDDSVLRVLQKRYPEATGPLLVHRLDMSTSGLLIAAKTKEAYHYIQNQFIKKVIQKRYVALLNGILPQSEGIIDLPLRVDFDNRPFQLVCPEHGKAAKTKWKVIAVEGNKTRVYFYPITGRTHQLRVHAAHIMGLNTPIVGDDLYGTKADRLHLHAEYLEIRHPSTKQKISFQADPEF
ncbi:RNA pseudouridine synthase [Taibaiella sp. KBW10]|uniref:RluA family pseudouridine synthase n=1 Tax=Taibaiella sp. KBW10 TaxID=2153357 RepID=UPI000F59C1B5|nr:RluA family pseudouridine synthase [Taibaiella sp. KBW10]RQO31760.1 RNA pseudouridine synthase [Taibaiella sp. KBW10]